MGFSERESIVTGHIKGLGKGVELAEELRDEHPADNLFAGIFNGKPPFERVFAEWPKPSAQEAQKRDKLVAELSDFLARKVDPYLIDDSGSVPLEIFEAMAKMGLYGIKVPEKWGGHGLSQTSYVEALSVAASWCSAIVIVLSADNTIGCKFPVMYYGTDEQKDRFLPELVKWPTGFCLTEKDVGSDPSKMKTYAVRVIDKDFGRHIGYELTGEKWFTTNGILSDGVPLAKYLAVVARIVSEPNPDVNSKAFLENKCFGLFIAPTSSMGVDIGTRNTFVGMRGIHNSNPRFNRVFVPIFNLIGGEGSGLKIAFESLNTGRIAIAKGCIGVSKQALNLTRWWADKRDQFGGSLSNKELIRDKLMYGATNILAMEAMTKYASVCFDRGQDIRIESAAAKMFASEKAWQIVDNLAQTRGGRFYEIWQSLSRRELTPPDEILWTGARPNRIFEGANELMVQLIFREGGDKYKKAAEPLFDKESSVSQRSAARARMAGYYMASLAVPNTIPGTDTRLISHLEFIDLMSRKLARKIISKGAKYGNKMPRKQLLMDRFSRIAINLGAMTLTCAYASQLDREITDNDYSQLADVFCRAAARETDELFRALDDNDDEYRWEVSKRLLAGDFDEFLLGGIIPMTEEHMKGPPKD